MDGGIEDKDVWQMRWWIIVIQPVSKYRAPQGAVGWQFVNCLAEELRGDRDRQWNVERPMVFMGVILKTTPGARKAHNICHRITRRLYLWESSQHAALCAGIVKENQLQPARKKRGQ